MKVPEGIIIEGVTGAGKTHVINALLETSFFKDHWRPCDFYTEEQTFGEFMTELRDNPDAPLEHKFRMFTSTLETVCARAAEETSYRFILERSHYSYYTLLRDWSLYQRFDERLASLNAHAFLLVIPHGRLKDRSLFRSDRDGWADGFIELYGSELAALDAIRASQAARVEALKKTVIRHTVIDTGSMDWDRFADNVATEIQRARSEGRR